MKCTKAENIINYPLIFNVYFDKKFSNSFFKSLEIFNLYINKICDR